MDGTGGGEGEGAMGEGSWEGCTGKGEAQTRFQSTGVTPEGNPLSRTQPNFQNTASPHSARALRGAGKHVGEFRFLRTVLPDF